MNRIDCWDLDGTILHTGRLFVPLVKHVADAVGLTESEVAETLAEVGGRNLTFEAWFSALGIGRDQSVALETSIRAEVTLRAQDFVHPGVREILLSRRSVARQVLITAGDTGYQRWKFGLLGLDDVFAEEDRHFVPVTGSKATVIGYYLSLGRVAFIDDRASWLREVCNQHASVICIRPRWPETKSAGPEEGDDILWQTAATAGRLKQLLERGAS